MQCCVVCDMQNAVSVFCRLGFAKKKSVSAESTNSETFHDSWRNLEQQNIITRKSVVLFVLCSFTFCLRFVILMTDTQRAHYVLQSGLSVCLSVCHNNEPYNSLSCLTHGLGGTWGGGFCQSLVVRGEYPAFCQYSQPYSPGGTSSASLLL